MTSSFLKSTPHKVGLNTRERFAFAYFHEPNFASVLEPLPGYGGDVDASEGIHYGTHFTNMCLRNYPDRITTRRLLREDRCSMLSLPLLRRGSVPNGQRSGGAGCGAEEDEALRGAYPAQRMELPSA